MGGIEEIIKQIELETSKEIEQIMSAAVNSSEKLRADYRKETDQIVETKVRQARAEADLVLSKIESGAQVKRKQDILRLKQSLIKETIEKAHKEMACQEASKYFDMLIQIAKNNAHSEEGRIGLNAGDLARVPADFNDKLKLAGVRLTIADEAYNIEDGMILDYGDIQENCTLKALINSKREKLQDMINKYIFE